MSLRVVLALLLAVLLLPALHPSTAAAYMGVYSPQSPGFKRLVVYYGWLNTSNLPSIDVDVVVVAGTGRVLPGGDDYGVVRLLRSRGVEVYAYLHGPGDEPVGLGSSYRAMVVENGSGTLGERFRHWLGYIEGLVSRYAGAVDGVFLDECDPSYFADEPVGAYVSYFTRGLGEVAAYAHSLGLKVFINGVMGYAAYGDYYLWEDYVDYATPSGYRAVAGFLRRANYSSPLEWVNGLSRYLYLAEHGLLGRTLAVSFADPRAPETIRWAKAGYALARIMGLAGWGYANRDYYAEGGPVPAGLVDAEEYGPPVSGPGFEEEKQAAWRAFAAGTVYVDYTHASVEENLVYRESRVVDAVPAGYWKRLPDPGGVVVVYRLPLPHRGGAAAVRGVVLRSYGWEGVGEAVFMMAAVEHVSGGAEVAVAPRLPSQGALGPPRLARVLPRAGLLGLLSAAA